jgi:hypothetical protein
MEAGRKEERLELARSSREEGGEVRLAGCREEGEVRTGWKQGGRRSKQATEAGRKDSGSREDGGVTS